MPFKEDRQQLFDLSATRGTQSDGHGRAFIFAQKLETRAPFGPAAIRRRTYVGHTPVLPCL